MSYYDSIAKGYNELHQEEQEGKLAIIIPYLQKKELIEGPIIDVGCGTGFSLDFIAKELEKECVGIEPSQGMIDQYQGKQKILCGKAENLPFANETFSASISITAIQNFDDVPQGVQEIVRVTKKEGEIIISCLKKSPKICYITQTISELLLVEKIIEEEKDLIFCCKRKS